MEKSEEYLDDLERWIRLRPHAGRLLDALRLIRFVVNTDHDSATDRGRAVRQLCELALKDTEDI